jgi:hypothetical protein
MKTFVAVLSMVALLGTACAVHMPYARSRSASSASSSKKCPPGHQWSDGRCHNKGRGHDPAKKSR